ncbi:MAG: ComF family protein, partial [Kiritimatiellae bacterium]|nr:ComF family protein [Kiritimatiellia bacterium]
MLEKVLDLLWPRRCAVCGGKADRPGRHLCSDCLMRIPFVPTDGLCRRCGRDAPGLDGEFLCSDCADELRPAFDRAASAMRFEGEARELVNAFKFRGALHLRGDFVDFLEATARARFRVGEIGFVAPMPSAVRNRFYRGYNQCDYLASALARRLGAPYAAHALRRVGVFRKQAGLGEKERRENVKGTFAV